MGAEPTEKPGDKSRAAAANAGGGAQAPAPNVQPAVEQATNAQAVKGQVAGVLQRLLASRGGQGDVPAPQPLTLSLDELLSQVLPALPGYADGGTMPAGSAGVVGEEGPEVAAAKPGGGVEIAPIDIDRPSMLKKILVTLGTVAMGPKGFQVAQTRRAQAEQNALLTLQHPSLLNNPKIAGKTAEVYGDEVVQSVAREGNPEYKALKQAEALGLTLVQPGTPGEDGTPAPSLQVQLAQAAKSAGMGVTSDNAGKMRLSIPPLQRAQADEIKSFGLYQQFREALEQNGVTGSAADVAAAQSLLRVGGQFGLLIPDQLRKLAFAKTTQDLAAAKAQITERIKQQTALAYEEPRASAGSKGRVIGEALGRINVAQQQVEVDMPDPTSGTVTKMTVPLSSIQKGTDPITDPNRLMGWVMPDGAYPPPGTTALQLMAAGAVPVSKETRASAARLRGIGDIVTDMRSVADKLFPTDDPKQRAKNAALYFYDQSWAKQIPEVQKLATLNARFGQLVTALGGESASRLSDADVARMIGGFSFGLFESRTSASTKLEVIERGLNALRDGVTSGRLIKEIQALGGDPAEVARLVGAEAEYGQRQKAASQRATERRNSTRKTMTAVIGGQPVQLEIGED